MIHELLKATATTHGEGQESLFHEPWQVLLSQLIGVLASVLTAVALIITAIKNRERHAATQRALEESVGVANGHGPLMEQVAAMRVTLAEHVAESVVYRRTVKNQLEELKEEVKKER